MIVVPDAPEPRYGRLGPIIGAYRGDGRYRVVETDNPASWGIEALSVTITGPATVADVEKRFSLPADLHFTRRNRDTVWIVDDGIGVTLRAARQGWWPAWRALAGDPRADETAGDHTVHHPFQ